VTEIAVFNPEAVGAADGRVDTAAGGAYHCLAEAHHQFDLVDAEMDWSRYRVLVLPDKIRLDDSLAGRLRAYLADGGHVLASHHSGLAADRDEFLLPELGVRYLGPARHSPDYLLARGEAAAGLPTAELAMFERGLEVETASGAETLAEVWHPYFDRTWEHFCSHRHTPAEKPSGFPAVVATSNAAYFAHPIFSSLTRHGVSHYKRLFLNVLRRFLPDPLVRTNAPSTARVSVQRQADPDRTIVHVLHYIPEQRYRDVQTLEDVIPLFDVDLALRLTRPPTRVYLAPSGEELAYRWEAGRAAVTVPEVRGHQMVVLEVC
jgi:hypothetical protein